MVGWKPITCSVVLHTGTSWWQGFDDAWHSQDSAMNGGFGKLPVIIYRQWNKIVENQLERW